MIERCHSLQLCPLPHTDLPGEYFEAQRISYERADDMVFILACYNWSYCELFNEARVKAWHNKMRWNFPELPPKPCSIPPTETVFIENTLRGHLTVAIIRDCFKADRSALDTTEHGWYYPEGSTPLFPDYRAFRHSSSSC